MESVGSGLTQAFAPIIKLIIGGTLIIGIIAVIKASIDNKKRKTNQQYKKKKKYSSFTTSGQYASQKYNYQSQKKSKKENIEDAVIVKDEKPKKKTNRERYWENIQKGIDFEKHVGKYYESMGYTIDYHGIRNKRADKGIDIIAKQKHQILLIQCKNWKSKQVTHKELKEFIGNTAIFLEKNQAFQNYKVIRLFIISNDTLHINAKKFLEENFELIKLKIIPY